MTTYSLDQDNIWKKNNDVIVELTEEQKQLLQTTDEDNAPARKALVQELRDKRFTVIEDPALATKLDTIYNAQKPILSDTDNYELIDIHITIDNNYPNGTGLLNCRVNSDHKQIRF